jgi:hypothetical protein
MYFESEESAFITLKTGASQLTFGSTFAGDLIDLRRLELLSTPFCNLADDRVDMLNCLLIGITAINQLQRGSLPRNWNHQ